MELARILGCVTIVLETPLSFGWPPTVPQLLFVVFITGDSQAKKCVSKNGQFARVWEFATFWSRRLPALNDHSCLENSGNQFCQYQGLESA
ncbi:hypothetical protein I7I53_04156 [Histoplasma capsulatum var. duboisii H88]|uniref:Uncharacterized protein n=1 Tax=Ajellomyces capsulatus (strain H88) TaxID=544711 RepID=A0A8A1LQJ0_AJEC8|nr:hypothetical protein I7I53_04156 [Histoplasma capsulatum var. duboisii H88]